MLGVTDFDDQMVDAALAASGSTVDQPRIERAVREILAAIGEDP